MFLLNIVEKFWQTNMLYLMTTMEHHVDYAYYFNSWSDGER